MWRSRPGAARLLAPVAWAYAGVMRARRQAYRAGVFPVARFERPVVVVGGITAGGSGKTPLVMHVVACLRSQGYRPGVVSRGYGGTPPHQPLWVEPATSPGRAGDEPALIARSLAVPVVVDRVRPRGVRALIDEAGCDVVVSDDGLQHYAMDRKVEIAVIGADDGPGTARCLPAGPFREPWGRLAEVDMIVRNNGEKRAGEHAMRLRLTGFQPLAGGAVRDTGTFSGRRVHAVAGIGHPDGFFAALTTLGLEVIPHPFPDHHRFERSDFRRMIGAPIVMTGKDAVKCGDLELEDAWTACVAVTLDGDFERKLIELLRQ